METSIRLATESDIAVLRDALVLALGWRDPAFPPDPERCLQESGHGHLIEQWGRPGDTALIAETPAGIAGAAWYRYWTREDHSYGFVDESIPELGIGVHHPYRGRGIGKALLVRLLEHARQQGIGAVSLSVERDNPALRLYSFLGFVVAGEVGSAYTMVKTL
jgi:ribosomal protein S18 acetylase RimI-like enzyme